MDHTMETIDLNEKNQSRVRYIFQQLADDSNVQKQSTVKNVCRICLENCPDIRFCQCFGGMLTHQQCLTQFLEVKIKGKVKDQNLMCCEICKYAYRIQFQQKCRFQRRKLILKIKQSPEKCAVYSIFFTISIFFYIFCILLAEKHQIPDYMVTILYVIGACVTVLLGFFIIVWLYQFAVVLQKRIGDILTIDSQLIYNKRIRDRKKSTIVPTLATLDDQI